MSSKASRSIIEAENYTLIIDNERLMFLPKGDADADNENSEEVNGCITRLLSSVSIVHQGKPSHSGSRVLPLH
jgi:hypothetical protein